MNLPGGGMPSPEYLAALNASLPPAPGMTADPRVSRLPPAGPPPPPAAQPAQPPPAIAVPYAAGLAPAAYFDAPPPTAGPWSGPDPTAALAQGIASNAPSPATAAAPAGPQPDPAPEHRPFLQQISGGGVVNHPAHETELRGPQLKEAQAAGDASMGQTINDVSERTKTAALNDYIGTQIAIDKANAREDAANASAAQRADELQTRQADFDASAKALSQQSVDPGRFWANASTGQKLSGLIAVTLGGFVQGIRGGSNPGTDAINTAIDRDVKAQEFAFQAQRDSLNAKQTAFSLAMQKYGNVDAARASARAAALDAASSQLAQQAALWKGTEAANRASMAQQALQDRRTQEIGQGVAFTPASQVAAGARYVDPRTGLTYSEQEAKGLVKTMDSNEFEREKIGLNTAGDVVKEQAKGGKGDAKDEGERTVVIEGKKQLALSKDKAEKWDKYNHARSVFGDALSALKEARAKGDVGAYNSARATLIETYPELLGYTRAPTEGQIHATVGPQAIPEYNHWYAPESVLTGGAGYVREQGRAQEKLDRLDSTVRKSDRAMMENTVGKDQALPNTVHFEDKPKSGELPPSVTFHGESK